MVCPRCQSENVRVETFQENTGSRTITKTSSVYKEKGHGFLWWLCIGWWWWLVDLFSWFMFFVPRLIMRIFAAPFKKKKYIGSSTTTGRTSNHIKYKTLCVCQNCGNTWENNPFQTATAASSPQVVPTMGSTQAPMAQPASVAQTGKALLIKGLKCFAAGVGLFLLFLLCVFLFGRN